MPAKSTLLTLCCLLGFVALTYSNHFHNSFHFDDVHTVEENPYIRDWRNIPRFFLDARTFSILPRNRTYRPLVSTSLAVDYWLGDGLDPFYFQLSTFCWFLVQLLVMYTLFRRICDSGVPQASRNQWIALFAVAWYGVHPAMAETVNYVIQRGDVYSTLGVVCALTLFVCAPKLRRFGLYLVPFVLAVLSKPPALIFPALLFVYIWLFEEEDRPGKWLRSIRRCVPAFVTAALLAALSVAMTPKEFNPGRFSASAYRLAQPLVALRFFRTFWLPDSLTADTDHRPAPHFFGDGAWLGFLFVLAIVSLAIVASRRKEWRPASFGIWWFLLALLPASVFPVYEVENDHRMFFPYVGLVLAVTWSFSRWIDQRRRATKTVAIGAGILCAAELAFCSLATLQRNAVWHDESTLWRDATIKSPGNGRAMLNYANALMQKNKVPEAAKYLQKAEELKVSPDLLETDLGVLNGMLHNDFEAQRHFQEAIRYRYAPESAHRLYARWLADRNCFLEALEEIRIAIRMNPDSLKSGYVLLDIFAQQEDWSKLERAANLLLARFPTDRTLKAYRLMAAFAPGHPISNVLARANAEEFLELSALHYEAGRMQACIAAAREALRVQPRYPEAYNNMAAAYRTLGHFDLAVDAARQALTLRPGFWKANENLTKAQEALRANVR